MCVSVKFTLSVTLLQINKLSWVPDTHGIVFSPH